MISRNKISLGLLDDTIKYADFLALKEKVDLHQLDLKKIHQVNFPDYQYYRKQTKKDKIVLHHTVSGQGVEGDINWWLTTTARIATHIIIDWKGEIYQCYSSKYWAHHLGVHAQNNRELNKTSIGVEIDSWGGLVRYNRNWYPAIWSSQVKKYVPITTMHPIPKENVFEIPEGYRGFYGFEKYTNEQLISLEKLLIYWHNRYGISLKYNENMWDVNEDALSGKPGIWTHTSFRQDKSDCYPDPRLIGLLKSFKE